MSACPSDWHLPSNDEWEMLIYFVGGDKVAGKYLKSKSGWDSYKGKSGNGEDKYGFSALPGGGYSDDGSFSDVGSIGDWWSASEFSYDASSRGVLYNFDGVGWGTFDKDFLFSVRCIQDQ
jgi:uncharacterized protein (TIGR02145 family)